jgi:hypothetical protein
MRQKAHPEFGRRYKANWLKRRPGYYRQYKINVRMKDPHWQVRERFATLLRNYLKKHRAIKGGRTEKLVGYSVIELRDHLESLFLPGMSWENYGEWHIDHIIPDSRFKYASAGDPSFKKSWALQNLQPLWAKDNLSKGNKIREAA